MSAEIDRLRGLLAGGTPGPWTAKMSQRSRACVMADDPEHPLAVCSTTREERAVDSANAALIVAAVNALPSLLDEIERLRTIERAAQTKKRGDDELERLDREGGVDEEIARATRERDAAWTRLDALLCSTPSVPSLPVLRTCGECGWCEVGAVVDSIGDCAHPDASGIGLFNPADPPPARCPLRGTP